MDDATAEASEEPQPQTKGKKLWDALNTPFVIFILTSILLGGLSFSYQKYSEREKVRSDRATRISHLITEIAFRTDLASLMRQPTFSYTAMFSARGALLGETGNNAGENMIIGEYSPIYPEFGQRNLMSLLWELQELERKDAKSFSLEASIGATRAMAPLMDDNVEMIAEKVFGKHGSTWRFTSDQARAEFGKDVALIRDSVAAIETR